MLILLWRYNKIYYSAFQKCETNKLCKFVKYTSLHAYFSNFCLTFKYEFLTPREKCPNTEFFLFKYFPVFELNTVFSPNAAKYGPEKNQYLDTFHAVLFQARSEWNLINTAKWL